MEEISGEHLRRFREHVADRDVSCPGCGYNLRGLTWPVCPECKQDLELRVGLVEPKIGAFVTGLIALAGGIGFHGVLMAYSLWLRAMRAPVGMPRDSLFVIGGSILFFAIAMTVWIWRRRSLRRLSTPARWALVIGMWVLFVASAVLLFSTDR
jgi:hypothetical protein